MSAPLKRAESYTVFIGATPQRVVTLEKYNEIYDAYLLLLPIPELDINKQQDMREG